MTLMDGGTVWNVNLVSAVERCKEIVDDESQIIMDIISCGSGRLQKTNETSNTIGNYLRYYDVKNYNKRVRDIYEFQKGYPNVTYRYFFKSS
jgi:hypothetical protein